MLNDPMGDLARVTGEYADFWNRVITSAGNNNADYQNFNGIYAGSNGDIFDGSGNDSGGHDVYITVDGKVDHITSNGSSENKYYGWEPGTDANGNYRTVTGQLNADQIRTRLGQQAAIQQNYINGRKQITAWQDPGIALYAFPVLVAGGVATIEIGTWAWGMWAGPAVRVEGEAAKRLKSNKIAGDAWRDEVKRALEAEGRTVYPEVTKSTPFGTRVIDLEVYEDEALLGGIETKVGNSRYLQMQRLKDIWLDLNTQGGYPVQLLRKP
jgi:hypothetical protein